jgi:hypothetical protein
MFSWWYMIGKREEYDNVISNWSRQRAKTKPINCNINVINFSGITERNRLTLIF